MHWGIYRVVVGAVALFLWAHVGEQNEWQFQPIVVVRLLKEAVQWSFAQLGRTLALASAYSAASKLAYELVDLLLLSPPLYFFQGYVAVALGYDGGASAGLVRVGSVLIIAVLVYAVVYRRSHLAAILLSLAASFGSFGLFQCAECYGRCARNDPPPGVRCYCIGDIVGYLFVAFILVSFGTLDFLTSTVRYRNHSMAEIAATGVLTPAEVSRPRRRERAQ